MSLPRQPQASAVGPSHQVQGLRCGSETIISSCQGGRCRQGDPPGPVTFTLPRNPVSASAIRGLEGGRRATSCGGCGRDTDTPGSPPCSDSPCGRPGATPPTAWRGVQPGEGARPRAGWPVARLLPRSRAGGTQSFCAVRSRGQGENMRKFLLNASNLLGCVVQ